MNIEMELLQAKFEAMRSYFLSQLPNIFKDDEQQKIDGSKVWLAKYFIWRFERENLSPLSYTLPQSSPDSEKIDRRRFQLQVLMDVAYIQGGLEAYDILRRISPHDQALADYVYRNSDGSEAGMIEQIEKYCNS